MYRARAMNACHPIPWCRRRAARLRTLFESAGSGSAAARLRGCAAYRKKRGRQDTNIFASPELHTYSVLVFALLSVKL